MILPSHAECRRVLDELDGDNALTEWEFDFIRSNATRQEFTVAQREVVARLTDKYDV